MRPPAVLARSWRWYSSVVAAELTGPEDAGGDRRGAQQQADRRAPDTTCHETLGHEPAAHRSPSDQSCQLMNPQPIVLTAQTLVPLSSPACPSPQSMNISDATTRQPTARPCRGSTRPCATRPDDEPHRVPVTEGRGEPGDGDRAFLHQRHHDRGEPRDEHRLDLALADDEERGEEHDRRAPASSGEIFFRRDVGIYASPSRWLRGGRGPQARRGRRAAGAVAYIAAAVVRLRPSSLIGQWRILLMSRSRNSSSTCSASSGLAAGLPRVQLATRPRQARATGRGVCRRMFVVEVAGLNAGVALGDGRLDERFGRDDLAVAGRGLLGDRPLQVVEVVEVHAGELTDRRATSRGTAMSTM